MIVLFYLSEKHWGEMQAIFFRDNPETLGNVLDSILFVINSAKQSRKYGIHTNEYSVIARHWRVTKYL